MLAPDAIQFAVYGTDPASLPHELRDSDGGGTLDVLVVKLAIPPEGAFATMKRLSTGQEHH